MAVVLEETIQHYLLKLDIRQNNDPEIHLLGIYAQEICVAALFVTRKKWKLLVCINGEYSLNGIFT